MWPLTSLGGDDSDVMPVLPLTVQLHRRGDEAGLWAYTKQGLRIRLRVYWESEAERERERNSRKSYQKKGEGDEEG